MFLQQPYTRKQQQQQKKNQTTTPQPWPTHSSKTSTCFCSGIFFFFLFTWELLKVNFPELISKCLFLTKAVPSVAELAKQFIDC